MAGLKSITFQSPGTLGLNTQDADRLQDPGYCTEALNCVISKNGLVESREGASKLNAVAATGTPTLDVVFSYIEDDGTENIISTGGNKIWVGTGTLTDKTGALTVTVDNWQFQNYAGEVFGYNGTDAPIYWNGGAGAFLTIASKGTAAGIVNSKCHLSAFGRSWVVDTTTVSQINYSDLLVPEDFTGGSSGTIDLNVVWPYSNDTITCLAVHNNNLIIFCERSIVVYGNADDVNNIYLVEVVKDIGCIARDSVQNIGNDLLFLSSDGVRSFSRTIIQDNMPISEISAPIRDEFINDVGRETPGLIRSAYNEKKGFYLINLPSIETTYVCDVRLASQGIYRWTKWEGALYGLASGYDDTLYFGLAGGFLAKYSGYNDLASTYIMKFRTGWIDPGLQTSKAIWKRALWYISSLTNRLIVTGWAFDFNDEKIYTTSASIQGSSPDVYGTGVYGTATYGGDYVQLPYRYSMKGTGSLIKLGFQSQVDGGKFAFNKVDLFLKTGSIR